MARSGWERLSASYRSRLVGAGRSGRMSGTPMSESETRNFWESGASMSGARSHRYGPKRARGAAPRKATELEMESMGTPQSYSELTKWRKKRPSRGGPPSWIPKDETEMRTDVAAILSQIDIPPERWATVDLVWLAAGGPVVMQITSRRGAVRSVTLPDAQAVHEVGRWIHGLEGGIEVKPHGSPGARERHDSRGAERRRSG